MSGGDCEMMMWILLWVLIILKLFYFRLWLLGLLKIEVDIFDDNFDNDLGMVLFGAEVIVIIYSTRIIIIFKVNFTDKNGIHLFI